MVEKGSCSDLHREKVLGLLEAHDHNPQELLTLILAHTQPTELHQNCHLSEPTVYGSSGLCPRWADLAVTF